MKICFILFAFLFFPISLFGQDNSNVFLEDFELKDAVIPPFENDNKPEDPAAVTVIINSADTLGRVSKYIFGNAVAVWLGQDVNNAVLVPHLQKLSPTLVRFPGGSWSDIYFWNGNPGDLPDSVYDGTSGQKKLFYPQFSASHNPTVDSYYNLREKLGAQGLITINYGYARYGLSEKPVEQAAHLAADWVRYDNGRTKFWEIGNENGGPWEEGWQIDTLKNKDGQPEIITGELYGQHFNTFVDSMKNAADEVGTEIFIGGQIIHFDGTNSWNIADRDWNEGFFREGADAADFYVIHNYFGGGAIIPRTQINLARTSIIDNINFIRQDIINKEAPSKPVAITEWNMSEPDAAKTSTINGLQAVVLFSEMIRNNFGMSCRWLIANWESDGMFYYGNDSSIPRWTPRPDFYYVYYLQRFVGDHSVSTSVSGSADILAYSTRFNSGHLGVVIANKGSLEQIVKLIPADFGFDENFYLYSLDGGDDNSVWPQEVFINGVGPENIPWGPLENLEAIPAKSFSTDNEIKFVSAANSVQYILIDPGANVVSMKNEENIQAIEQYKLNQNYPNPFNPKTSISFSLVEQSNVTLKVYDLIGREIVTVLLNEKKNSGHHKISFDAAGLPSGVYFYKISTENFSETKKMVLIK